MKSATPKKKEKKNHVNMKNVRGKIKMMNVDQISVYHTLLEAYNIPNKTFILLANPQEI